MHQILSASEQVAAHLRQELQSGRWTDTMPGEHRLVAELGGSHNTIKEALRQLEEEGWLVNQGPGKQRRILMPRKEAVKLRIRILLYERSDRTTHYLLEMIRLLQDAGHNAAMADKAMGDLGMDVGRIARFVKSTEADAWIIASGSRDVLDWFAQQVIPAFALFGRAVHAPLASISPKKAEAYAEVVDKLVTMGHRRIVRLVREDRRKPSPGYLEQLFLDELEKHGIKTGPYNLPDWQDTDQGLKDLLDKLFQHTPPTAILIDGAMLFSATRNHLARHGILAPEHVSLVCSDPDPIFAWDIPAVTHIAWDHYPLVSRVVKWANNIGRGKDDRRKNSIKAKLITGGTIGPAP
jgi:DNA-binding transcriptional regulator YhcF (GntR family)